MSQVITNFLEIDSSANEDEANEAREAAFRILDQFEDAPFSIQRLSELLSSPTQHYISLPKYLRALSKLLSITSTVGFFGDEEVADESITSQLANRSGEKIGGGLAGGGIGVGELPIVIMGPRLGMTKHPIHPFNPHSTSHSNTHSRHNSRDASELEHAVLMEPIPWLQAQEMETEYDTVMDDVDMQSVREGGGMSLSPSPSALSSRKREFVHEADMNGKEGDTNTPTGGLVDELDPGTGGNEVVDPISITSHPSNPIHTSISASTSSLNTTHDSSTNPLYAPIPRSESKLDLDSMSEELRSRFVRASSPKIREGVLDRKRLKREEGDMSEDAFEEREKEEKRECEFDKKEIEDATGGKEDVRSEPDKIRGASEVREDEIDEKSKEKGEIKEAEKESIENTS